MFAPWTNRKLVTRATTPVLSFPMTVSVANRFTARNIGIFMGGRSIFFRFGKGLSLKSPMKRNTVNITVNIFDPMRNFFYFRLLSGL
jgi:hypothetical protein